MPEQDFTVDVESARLRGSDWTPAGPERGALVALHAGVADRRAWNACALDWAAAGWRVVAHDRRGYGDSEWDAVPHDHVADLVAVLDDRAIGPGGAARQLDGAVSMATPPPSPKA